MKHLKTFESFSHHNIFESIPTEDRSNYTLIFNSLYNKHLTINEKIIIENQYGLINESWFSDLADKSKRGVLAVKSKAGEILINMAKKAKDLLDFAKTLADQIGNYVKTQFMSIEEKVKNYALKDTGFIKPLIEFIENKKLVKLKSYITGTSDLLKYIVTGQIITDLITKLSELFSNVLNLGTNEGFNYLENEFLLEAEEVEKKSFLQRMGEKISTYPPFSWIPKIEELMKKGISKISQLIDKFFHWLTTGKSSLGISKFSKSFTFIFQILELYVFYKVLGDIKKFKDYISKATGFDELTNSIKDKTMDEIWKTVGFNSEEISSNIKAAVMKIPYVGTILGVLDTLVLSVGVYMTVKPLIEVVKI